MWLPVLLLLVLITPIPAADESCMDRCENGFDSEKKCQCDSMCKYYESCCSDYDVTCGMMTRGDTFVEDDDDDYHTPTQPALPTLRGGQWGPTLVPDLLQRPPAGSQIEMTKPQRGPPPSVSAVTAARPSISGPRTAAPDPDADHCSGRPFDSFMRAKNGSVYAFRGQHFFELGQRSVLPGYPKRIEDVWGISGPIDAAFTRFNCQGKTYIFKGSTYWRFDDGVLEGGYPRNISVGFQRIPDHVDAAFALPAAGYGSKEKVYFFKGDQYYIYEFLHQPSHEQCVTMSESSPSVPFRSYTGVYYNNYEHVFRDLFSGVSQHDSHHSFIGRDWKGITYPVHAALAGRIHVPSGRWTPGRGSLYLPDQQWGFQQGQQWNQQWGRRRQNRSPQWGSMAEQGMSMGEEMAKRGMEMGMRLAERRMEMEERLGQDWGRGWDQDWDQDRRRGRQNNNRGNYDRRGDRRYWEYMRRSLPTQSVYFFKGDQYYRVNLSSRRVDLAMPPYPRSIAKHWFGCSSLPSGAERK
ncbi:vitronectin-like isoform X2 [Synchiropus splendidus]|uniref:vitronectin-like isoform X2 n=1 Tax=Synchiropus splendidus TaxID=270530 RepID=UPI00237D73B4|nr:vitronectin-like isoform X2 [Synchiropus splendidus]